MIRCNKCAVTLKNPRDVCPLCQNVVVGEVTGERESYPEIPTVYSQFRIFFRVMIFVSILCGVAAVAFNLLLPGTGWWSIILLSALGYMWSTLITAVKRKYSIAKKLLYQVLGLSVLLIAIDRADGAATWSINYVIPALHASAMLATTILAYVQRFRFGEYLLHILVTGVLGLIPLLLVLVGWVDVLWPSLSCTLISIAALAFVSVFESRAASEELQRRFHL